MYELKAKGDSTWRLDKGNPGELSVCDDDKTYAILTTSAEGSSGEISFGSVKLTVTVGSKLNKPASIKVRHLDDLRG